jgi:hypothetical protein
MQDIALSQFGFPTFITPSEPTALQTALQKQFNDTGITIADNATGGLASTLANELDGMDGGGVAEPQRMTQAGAKIVIQEHMLNEAATGEDPAQYAAYLGQWIQDARDAGLTPVLDEGSPTCDANHPNMSAYVDAMEATAVKYGTPIIKQYAFVQGFPGWQSHMVDCVYPDAYLNGLRAQQALAVIAPLVQKEMTN